jgi:hypothetical protein
MNEYVLVYFEHKDSISIFKEFTVPWELGIQIIRICKCSNAEIHNVYSSSKGDGKMEKASCKHLV